MVWYIHGDTGESDYHLVAIIDNAQRLNMYFVNNFYDAMLKHQMTIRAVSVLVQISLNNHDNPLYDMSEYTDHH